MQVKYPLSVLIGLMIAALVGCGGGSSSSTPPPPPPPTVTGIALSPQNTAVTTGSSISFKATGTFSDGSQSDITSSATWTSSDTTVATVSAGSATGVKKGVVTITAASGSGKASTLLNVTDLTLSNATLKKGSYAFFLEGIDTVGPIYAAGSFTSDGNGNLTGVVDANTSKGGVVASNAALTGTYTIGADGRGIMTVTANGIGTNIPFQFVISKDGTKGKLIEFDGKASIAGSFEAQAAGAISGTYVFRVVGLELGTLKYTGEIGVMTAAAGNLTGTADENLTGTNFPHVSITPGSTFSSADSNNRGTLTLNLADAAATVHFVYYLVSANKFVLISTDAGSGQKILGGVAETQTSPAVALNDGTYSFLLDHGATLASGNFEKAGQLALTGGAVNSGSIVEDLSSNTVMDQSFAINPPGAYMVTDPLTGRGTLSVSVTFATPDRHFVYYPVDATRAYLMETTCATCSASAFRAGTGELETSAGSATLPVAGDFIFSAFELGETDLLQVGQLESDGNGKLSGIVDLVSQAGLSTPTVASVGVDSAAASGVWTMTPAAAFPFQYSITPSNSFFIANYFVYVRPDGSRATLLGFKPDIDGFMDLQ